MTFDDPAGTGFSEHAARRVLERAIELDQLARSRVSEAELRSVAAEAGVSTAAFDQAIRELHLHTPGASTDETQARTPKLANWWKHAAWGAVGGAVFMLLVHRLVDPEFGPALVGMAGGVVALASAVATWRARETPQLKFHVTNTLLWLSAWAGIWIVDPVTTASDPANTIASVLALEGWIVSTLTGSIVGALTRTWRLAASTRTTSGDSQGGSTARGGTREQRDWRDTLRQFLPHWIKMDLHESAAQMSVQ